ncbi:MAG: galactose oxidase-like domain-containing protein [Bryobacteraceae bacterium]
METSFWKQLPLSGKVSAEEKRQLEGLVIEAWDGSDRQDEFLGRATIDDKGRFEISVDSALFRDFPGAYEPEVYFNVFDGEKLLFCSEPIFRIDLEKGLRECSIRVPKHCPAHPYVCKPRHIYLKIEKILAYSPVDPDPDAHGMFRKDCMHNEGHDDGIIPDAEVTQRTFDAVIYREYTDSTYVTPRTNKLADADVREPSWYRRVPGAFLYLKPGRRVQVHVLNGDNQPHTLHVHGLAYGVDSDGSFPFGVEGPDGRSDQICPGARWTYEFDVTEEMIGCWPFHSHFHHIQEVTDLGLFGGIVVRDPKRPHPDLEVPFFLHRMIGERSGSAFDSGNLSVNAAYNYTFPALGSFNYYCRFHPMNGTVNVVSGGPATAAVSIQDGPSRFDPATVTIGPGGTVTWTNFGIQIHTVTEAGGAGSLESWCINGRSFLGNTPLIEAKSGRRIRWYVFNLDLSPGWHNFHTHGQRWRWGSANVDTRSIGPAESFQADTIVPPVILPPCRTKEPDPKKMKDYHFCGDFPVHCHVEHHMMQGMVAAVRAQQHMALTADEYAGLRFKPNHYCMPADHGGHGGCPHVDHDRCKSAGGGKWEQLPDSPIFVVHAAMMHTGRILLWSGTAEVGYPEQSYVFDPTANTFSGPQIYGEDLFCAGQTFLADGRVLVAGGAPQFFLKSTHIFDPATEVWTKLTGHDMNRGRWYPTLVPLSDGKVFAASGRIGSDVMEVFDPATSNWTVMSGADKDFSQLYSSLHLIPAGQIFYSRTGWAAMAGTQSAKLDFSGTTGSWTDMSPMTFPDREEGASVILIDDTVSPPNARIVVFGGGVSGAFNKQSCEAIDVTSLTPAPSWDRMADMAFQRTNVNGVILPDGKILAIGGQRNGKWAANPQPVLEVEMFDPAANTWTTLAPMTSPRQYHSVGVLLPDGRVFTAGGIDPTLGGAPARDLRKIEIFSPPYLFAGARPTITSAPATASYGATIAIDTPDAGNIASVVLMRPTAVTHHTDAGQRYVRVKIQSKTGTSVSVRMPGNGFVAPPGFYMLFVLNSSGVPSVARWIKLS